MFKLVSFDVWNTLLDINLFYRLLARGLSSITGWGFDRVYELVLKAYREAKEARLRGLFRRPLLDSARFYAEHIGIGVEDLYRALLGVLDSEDICKLKYEDSEPVLDELKSRGLRIAVLGNVMFWPGMITRYVLLKNGLLKYIDYSFFGDEIMVQKPSREAYQFLAEATGYDPGEIIHVGDSLVNDFMGALQAGFGAALLLRDRNIGVVRISDRVFIISGLKQLLEII